MIAHPAGSQFVLVVSSWVSNNIMKAVCRGRASEVFWQQDAYRRVAQDAYRRVTAAAKLLQSCQTLCDPIDGSPPGFPSLGFSRQEHWSGLPFPSPMHESEK